MTRKGRPPRRALLISTVLLGSLLPNGGVDTAHADTPLVVPGAAWSVVTQGDQIPVVTPTHQLLTGTVCPYQDLQSIALDGSTTWSFSTTAPGSRCDAQYMVTDSSGTTYVHGLPDDSGISAIDATGQIEWTTTTSDAQVPQATPVLGWDNRVYVVTWDGRDTFTIHGLNRDTGAIERTIAAPNFSGLSAYSDGLIVVGKFNSYVDYYGYDGLLKHEYAPDPGTATGPGFASGGNGTVFLAGTDASCHPTVQKFTPAGSAWVWQGFALNLCTSQSFVSATPDNGVIATPDWGRSYFSISATGVERWSYAPEPPQDASYVSGEFLPTPLVDLNGVVGLPLNYSYLCSDQSSLCYGERIDYLSQSSKTASRTPLVLSDAVTPGWVLRGAALDTNRIYLGLNSRDAQKPSGISAFDEAGLAGSYAACVASPECASSPPPPPPPDKRLALTATPTKQTVGNSVTLRATVRDAQGNPAPDELVTFGAKVGPDAGRFAAIVRTDASGIASTTRTGIAPGADTFIAWLDSNANGVVDPGELSATTTVTWLPQPRYLVFGDSVAYGHGLANPNEEPEDGLPANQGPSSMAWPDYVDRALPGLRPLLYRPTSCELRHPASTVYDQLAYSGAPSIANRFTGKDTNCTYANGVAVPVHKAVYPDEVGASGMHQDPPALVTIQAGANDINFAACLESVLGVPTFLGAQQCATRDRNGRLSLSRRVSAELASLQTGLALTIEAVHKGAPHAQVVLVNYYQVIPRPDANLTGTTRACRDLRASAKNSRFRTDAREIGDFIQAKLNATISQVGARYRYVLLVNIGNLFAGHEMCTLKSWLFDGSWDTAHPTAVGQVRIGAAVVAECDELPRKCVGR